MKFINGISVVVVCVASGVLLAGCAGLGGEPGSTTSSKPESPLEKYWSLLYGGQDQADVDRQNAEVQDKIASCMSEQGFDYVPDVQGSGSFVMADDSGLDWGSEEFAKTFGYGITTDPLGLNGGSGDQNAEHVDPNADYVASLSPSEQAAYNDALWGRPQEGTTDSEPADYDWSTSGCNGTAQHEVFGEGGFGNDPEFAALSEGMNALSAEELESPAVKEKEQVWADCMADAGYGPFDHKDDASAAISDAYSALVSPADGDATMSTTPPEPDPATLDALKQREIAQATTDFACARDSGYTDTFTAEQFRIEQAFVDDHQTELDALVARYGDASK